MSVSGSLSALPARATSTSPAVVPEAAEQQDPGSTPFGGAAEEVSDGPLVSKWQYVQQAIQAELQTVSACRNDMASCASPAAIEFLSIVDRAKLRDGLARVGEINRYINMEIKPVSDMVQYHVADFWSSPLATIAAHAGDCEDYAIAKLIALKETGIPSRDLRLVILRNNFSQEDHAVVTARVDGRWRVLDSRGFLMLDDVQYVNFRPVFLIDDVGIKRYDDFSQTSASSQLPLPYL